MLGVMQPYLFPYWPYFQLLAAVDQFVLLDNVAFPKKKFVNRNSILSNHGQQAIVLPIHKPSQNRAIADHQFHDLPQHSCKLMRQIYHAYRKAPYFETLYPELEKILTFENPHVVTFLHHSFNVLCRYLAIDTPIELASNLAITVHDRQERMICLCQQFTQTVYLNLPGGRDVYDANHFAARHIQLAFIQSELHPYTQLSQHFVPNLSAIDVMMFHDRSQLAEALTHYRIDYA